MSTAPFISKSSLSRVSCPLLKAAYTWWQNRSGIAELNDPSYMALVPNFQIATLSANTSDPFFFFVGEQSLTAQILGHKFTPAMRAGEWWDDGGYANSVSASYQEVVETGNPSLEDIKAYIRLPGKSSIVLNYQRMCLPTRLECGDPTVTVVTRQKSILKAVN